MSMDSKLTLRHGAASFGPIAERQLIHRPPKQGTNQMWQVKTFRTLADKRAWTMRNALRFQIDSVFCWNGYGVTYKRWRRRYDLDHVGARKSLDRLA